MSDVVAPVTVSGGGDAYFRLHVSHAVAPFCAAAFPALVANGLRNRMQRN